VRINGAPHWWFKDRDLPTTRTALEAAMESGGPTGAAAPAADNNSNLEGGDHGDAAA
jgi:hypothetical protein